jgi:hypothetical protein
MHTISITKITLQNCELIVISINTNVLYLLKFSKLFHKTKLNSIFLIHLFTCAYIVWSIFPSYSLPLFLLHNPLHFQAEPVLPLSLILLKRKHKHNKKDKQFLLVVTLCFIQETYLQK